MAPFHRPLRNYVDPWDKRRHPTRYTPKALRAMLVEDLVKVRAPGGPMERGAQWLVLACAEIAHAERKPVDDVWADLLDEASAQVGHRVIPVSA
jgi:hypothetical protein